MSVKITFLIRQVGFETNVIESKSLKMKYVPMRDKSGSILRIYQLSSL